MTKGSPDSSRLRGAPNTLPVLPIREGVVFPLTISSVFIDSERSRRLVEEVTKGNRLVALVAQRDGDARSTYPEELYAFGTVALLRDTVQGPDGVLRAAVQGLERVRIVGWEQTDPYLLASVLFAPDAQESGHEIDALVLAVRSCHVRFNALVTEPPNQLPSPIERVGDPRQLAYLLASTTPMVKEARQHILEHQSVKAKLRRIIEHLQQDIAVRESMRKIANETPSDPASTGDASLRRQSDSGAQREPPEERTLRARLAALPLPVEARNEVDRELEHFERTPAASPERAMIRTYLDWMAKLPWNKRTGGPIDIARTRQQLDHDHHHLTAIKDRIVEDLAVRQLRADRGMAESRETGAVREPILCFVGPPGVGKTSLGESIARALGRRFARIALGGIHDEAEIRGHRRTYVGAMPGRIVQELARAGASDPVFVLDEIDKLRVGYHGDPSGALLEVLDPAQNRAFMDNYLGVPFDLSRVLFVCTANTAELISLPLLDRMEVLALSGYTDAEKIAIARGHLLPRAIAAHGLTPAEIDIDEDAVRSIVRSYTREAGVRGLTRELSGVLRKVARNVAHGALTPIRVGPGEIESYLGSAPFADEMAERIDRPGVATGLAWTPTGGDILFVEATLVGDEERLVLTGMMGEVMRESAQAALSFLRYSGARLGIDPRAFERKTVHVHVPAGAVPKDGPSAGVTILAALASLATGRPVPSDIALSGELTLRGRVLPVGGVKEKVLAAHRAGLKAVVLPARCAAQLEGVPEDIRGALQILLVDSAEDVLSTALGLGEPVTRREPATGVEPDPVPLP